MGIPLTEKRLEAIEEALRARLSGPYEEEFPKGKSIDRKHYEAALEWAVGKLLDKELRKLPR